MYGKPRLESVIECYQELENNLIDKNIKHPFLNGFSSFWECEPNNNHYLFAKLLRRGANIVTTNYDQCIPKAYQQIVKKENELKLRTYGTSTGYYYYTSQNSNVGKIYHIHGVAADLDTLGATLKQLKPGLALQFCQQMKLWLKEGYTFIFLGYEGGDSLDVNPFFNSLNTYPGTYGIYVRHSEKVKGIISKSEYRENEKLLLKPFQHKIVFEGNTSTFLTNFNIEPTYIKTGNYDVRWDKKFYSKCTSYDEELRLALSIQLCHRLGLDTSKILPNKWWIQFSTSKKIEQSYIQTHGAATAKMVKSQKIINYFKPQYSNPILWQSNYWASQHQYKKAATVFGNTDNIYANIIEHINKRKNIGWHFSTALNRWFNYILSSVISFPPKIKSNIIVYQKDAENLLKSYELIIQNSDLLIAVPQQYTALRSHALLKLIFLKDPSGKQTLLQVINSYEQISYTSGVIGTMSLYITYMSLNMILFNDRNEIRVELTLIKKLLLNIIKNKHFYYLYHFGFNCILFAYGVLFAKNY